MPKAGGLKNPIVQIPRLVAGRQYRVGLHAVRHMIEEGFDEKQLVEALSGHIQVLEEYPDEGRFLVVKPPVDVDVGLHGVGAVCWPRMDAERVVTVAVLDEHADLFVDVAPYSI